jgi:hypothetical protein
LGTTPIYWEYGQSRMYYSVAAWWEEKDWYHKPIVVDCYTTSFLFRAIHLNYKWYTGRLFPPNNLKIGLSNNICFMLFSRKTKWLWNGSQFIHVL